MTTIVAPDRRQCERCGRQDRWDEEQYVWRIVRNEDGTRKAGRVDCLHEWDINGTFNPIAERES